MRNRFVSVKFCFKRKNETFLDFQPLCHFLKLLTMPIISFENQFEIIAISYFLLRQTEQKKKKYNWKMYPIMQQITKSLRNRRFCVIIVRGSKLILSDHCDNKNPRCRFGRPLWTKIAEKDLSVFINFK